MKAVTSKDFDTVYDIYMDESVNPFMLYDPCSKEVFQKVFNDLIDLDYFWLFQHEGKDCGMCGIIKGKGRMSHVAMICSLGIKQEFQGLGLGKKLLNDVLQKLKDEGFIRIELQVEADNEKAITFYKKMRFSVEGRQEKFLKRANDNDYIDELMMAIVY